jgi:hypothetical protein
LATSITKRLKKGIEVIRVCSTTQPVKISAKNAV